MSVYWNRYGVQFRHDNVLNYITSLKKTTLKLIFYLSVIIMYYFQKKNNNKKLQGILQN